MSDTRNLDGCQHNPSFDPNQQSNQALLRSVLRGVDGPELSVTPLIAWLWRPALMQWWRRDGSRFDQSIVAASVAAIEYLASLHEQSLVDGVSGNGYRLMHPPQRPATVDKSPLTTAEAAKELDLSERHIRNLCATGCLLLAREGRPYAIQAQSVEAEIERRRTAST